MLTIALWTTGAALGAFVVYFILVAHEARIGRRVVLRTFRGWLDTAFTRTSNRLKTAPHLSRRAAIKAQEQASNIRSLMAPRPALYRTEDRKEAARLRSKRIYQRAKRRAAANDITSAPDTHLTALQQHRTETALSPEEAKKLRNLKLEERF